jgi:hypothetical protein
VAAKTSWNIRKRLTPVLASTSDSTRFVANFVNGEKVDPNKHLLAGDINADNAVTLSDVTILQQNYLTTNPVADLNGDDRVNASDYGLLQINFGAKGDAAVNQP